MEHDSIRDTPFKPPTGRFSSNLEKKAEGIHAIQDTGKCLEVRDDDQKVSRA
jgi:hypothetical protein